jgi:predicted ATPase
MRFTKIYLHNWRNFLDAEIDLTQRVFLVGPNASGKSNFLDAFRFLRDVAETGGGIQKAISERRGLSRIRSLHARRRPDVIIDAVIEDSDCQWRYHLAFSQDNVRRPLVKEEKVWKNGELLLDRPDENDRTDPARLGQTHLEQISANKEFRPVAEFLGQIRYLHLVPQLIREPERSVGKDRDPYGGDFLEQLARLQKENSRVFDSRMKKIGSALKTAVPQLKDLQLERDPAGRPHLSGLYEHWRPGAGWQREEEFSDGTLRILGLLWSLLDGDGPLLLEEPELSLHDAVVRFLPGMMWRISKKSRRQVFVSTHSATLLSDPSIGLEEILLLSPTREGTSLTVAASNEQIRALVEGGISVGDAVLPQVAPSSIAQLMLGFPE